MFTWLGDMCIAVGQGPALFQSLVVVIDRMHRGAMLVKYHVGFGDKLNCRRELALETT